MLPYTSSVSVFSVSVSCPGRCHDDVVGHIDRALKHRAALVSDGGCGTSE